MPPLPPVDVISTKTTIFVSNFISLSRSNQPDDDSDGLVLTDGLDFLEHLAK
jgi:hypothetical protein